MKLYIIPSWYPSKLSPASGAFFVDWAGILAAAGHDVVIVASVLHSFRKLFKYRLLPKEIHPPRMEFGLLTYRREAINPFPKLVKKSYQFYKKSLTGQFEQALAQQGRPDIVLVHSSLWAGAALADRLSSDSIPFIVSEHIKEFLLPEGLSDFQKKCVLKTYQYASKVVAVSSALEKQILKTFPDVQGKTTTIHNPLAKQMMVRPEMVRKAASDFTFIAVSFLRAEKRIDVLLAAFARLIELGRPVKLKIVGDGPQRSTLERKVCRMNLEDRIEFRGYLTKEGVAGELRHSDCLVLPSEVETFGLALVEAMACGLPVIGTRCGGPEDIITDETGILVPVNDELALCQAMQAVMENYSNYDPDKIHQYAAEKFGEQTYVDAYQGVFAELVSGP